MIISNFRLILQLSYEKNHLFREWQIVLSDIICTLEYSDAQNDSNGYDRLRKTKSNLNLLQGVHL